MLEVRSLGFEYPEKWVLQDVSFHVEKGVLLHLRGANGVGKTTLLRLLAGILKPLQGEVCYQGVPISNDTNAYQQNICFVGHKPGFSPLLTVRENCYFDLHQGRSVLSMDELMSAFSLDGLGNVITGMLSLGQKRRLSLLRLWMTDALVWLLDEPLVGLDKDAMDTFMLHLKQHLKRGGIVILTSHQNLPMYPDLYQEYTLS